MTHFTMDLKALSELGVSPQLFNDDDLTKLIFDQLDNKAVNENEKMPFLRLDSIDKITGLDNNWMEMNSDMGQFMEMTAIDEVKTEAMSILLDSVIEECGIKDRVDQLEQAKLDEGQTDMEQTQSLIEEVEDYLKAVEGRPTVVEEAAAPTIVEGNPNFEDSNTGHDTDISIPEVIQQGTESMDTSQNTDAVLNALVTGQVSFQENNSILTEAHLSQAYTTRLVTQTGENVVIIIAPPSPANSEASFTVPQLSPAPSVSPGPSTVSVSDSDLSDFADPEWSPTSPFKIPRTAEAAARPRRKYQRKKPLKPPVAPYPTDKKERKKAQNRSAAFKYREKKKAEQDAFDTEVEELEAKNVSLKEKVSDLENEMKYLKKLMTEAGLGVYAQAVKI